MLAQKKLLAQNRLCTNLRGMRQSVQKAKSTKPKAKAKSTADPHKAKSKKHRGPSKSKKQKAKAKSKKQTKKAKSKKQKAPRISRRQTGLHEGTTRPATSISRLGRAFGL